MRLVRARRQVDVGRLPPEGGAARGYLPPSPGKGTAWHRKSSRDGTSCSAPSAAAAWAPFGCAVTRCSAARWPSSRWACCPASPCPTWLARCVRHARPRLCTIPTWCRSSTRSRPTTTSGWSWSTSPGETLSQLIARDGRLDPERVAAIGAQVADGLAAAHARGTVHRDVKPGNVLIAGDTAKISDFGIARTHGDDQLTRSGVVMGTPLYFSPELARGADPSPSGRRLGTGCHAVHRGRGGAADR